MKKLILIFFFLLTSNAYSKETLTIYTYDSFVSEWGPGPIIKEMFEAKCDCELIFVSTNSAANLLIKVLLEGKSTRADIILGLDMNLLEQAKKTNLFKNHELKNLEILLDLPLKWNDKVFVPFDYSYFAFVYNNKKFNKTSFFNV